MLKQLGYVEGAEQVKQLFKVEDNFRNINFKSKVKIQLDYDSLFNSIYNLSVDERKVTVMIHLALLDT